MKEQKDSRGVAARNTGPFAWNTVSVNRNEFDVVGHWPDRAYLVKTLAPLGPSVRTEF
jgi:hypothetical protein